MSFKVAKVNILDDPELSLAELKALVLKWIDAFGEEAIFKTDAGYNNVTCTLEFKK